MDSSISYEDGWQLIKNVFPILKEPQTELHNDVPEETLMYISELITKLGAQQLIQTLVVNKIEKHLREFVVPRCYLLFLPRENHYDNFVNFHRAIEDLHNVSLKYIEVAIQLVTLLGNKASFQLYGETDVTEGVKLIIRSTLLSQLPIDHDALVRDFYEIGLKMHDGDGYFQDKFCTLCCQQSIECNCVEKFFDTNRILVELGLLEPMIGQILTYLTYQYIENHVEKVCNDNFDTSFSRTLKEWLENSVIKWLGKVHLLYFNSTTAFKEYMISFRQKLGNFLYEVYTKVRIKQFFNIIIEYPDSIPALEDLRRCLAELDSRPQLIRKLQKSLESRLLHPGVSTPDILTAYVSAIRSIKILDPSGMLLETLTQPIHQYLRSRDDTVRCVVSSLTEEGSNELAEELIKGDIVQVEENNPSDDESENWENWLPDPVDIQADTWSNTRRTADIISMLVKVYGSKELFVNEYRTLLADRLLSQCTCNAQKEIRYLELLKLRFGDSQLHYCEVMLKDVADSKRINQHIQQDPNYNEECFPLSAMIVSAQFWPPFKDEKLELHPKVAEKQELYTQSFQMLKGNRTLSWKNHLGVVDIEIETQDRTLNLSVSPIHATILMHFQDKNEWELEDLSRIMHVPPTMLRRKIGLWQSHGLIEETKLNIFELVDTENKIANTSTEVVEEYESESAMTSIQDQREEELQTFWSYIVGMLMNLDSLPLERIHQMLKMFAFQGPTIECSLQELKNFLDRKVKEHQLVFSGVYKLPKGDSV